MQRESHKAEHADEHGGPGHHHHSEKLPPMKSAAFKLDDVRPFGNMKLYDVEGASTPFIESEKAAQS